jgi:hypothetical protein
MAVSGRAPLSKHLRPQLARIAEDAVCRALLDHAAVIHKGPVATAIACMCMTYPWGPGRGRRGSSCTLFRAAQSLTARVAMLREVEADLMQSCCTNWIDRPRRKSWAAFSRGAGAIRALLREHHEAKCRGDRQSPKILSARLRAPPQLRLIPAQSSRPLLILESEIETQHQPAQETKS